jgi:hypothetical protein
MKDLLLETVLHQTTKLSRQEGLKMQTEQELIRQAQELTTQINSLVIPLCPPAELTGADRLNEAKIQEHKLQLLAWRELQDELVYKAKNYNDFTYINQIEAQIAELTKQRCSVMDELNTLRRS